MWRAARAAELAIQRLLGWRARQLAEVWRDLRRLSREGPPDEARLRELARFWFHGGWDTSAALSAVAEGKCRCIRLVVQPDGDVLLCLPADFGSVADDQSRADAFMSDVNRQLASMRRSLSVNWGALVSLATEIVSLAGGMAGAVHGALTTQRLVMIIWLAGSGLLPIAGRFVGRRLLAAVSRIALKRLRAFL